MFLQKLYALTLRVQQLGKSQFFLSHIECILKIVVSIGPLQVVKLNQVRSAEDRNNCGFNKNTLHKA